jgi:hypothetical protein
MSEASEPTPPDEEPNNRLHPLRKWWFREDVQERMEWRPSPMTFFRTRPPGRNALAVLGFGVVALYAILSDPVPSLIAIGAGSAALTLSVMLYAVRVRLFLTESLAGRTRYVRRPVTWERAPGMSLHLYDVVSGNSPTRYVIIADRHNRCVTRFAGVCWEVATLRQFAAAAGMQADQEWQSLHQREVSRRIEGSVPLYLRHRLVATLVGSLVAPVVIVVVGGMLLWVASLLGLAH